MTQNTVETVDNHDDDEVAALAPPPDERNPAIIDARKTFVITLVGAALFVGAVFVFLF
jgi:hypothetical protein